MRADQSVVIVTGGSSGLGAATVGALAAAGAKPVVFDRQEGPGSDAAVKAGGTYHRADIRSEDDVLAGVRTAQRLGEIRGLVCCAGIAHGARTAGRDGLFEKAHKLIDFQRVVDVNLVGMFNCVRLVSTAMSLVEPDTDGERGSIVLTASVAAYDGQIGQAAYTASKAGVIGMVLPMARELAAMGVRVNAVAPGVMRTPMLGEVAEEVLAQLADTIPFPKRVGEPSEFAALAVHLLSNTYINGETIRIDGAVRMPPR